MSSESVPVSLENVSYLKKPLVESFRNSQLPAVGLLPPTRDSPRILLYSNGSAADAAHWKRDS
jgi:hypothetical protein